MIKIAICDDEKNIVQVLSREIEEAFRKFEVAVEITSYSSGLVLKKEIFSGMKYDVIFLDIGMPDINGIIVAKRLKEYDRKPLIIFVSNKEEHVYESFSAKPFRFLRKSTFRSEIHQTVEDIIEELNPKDSGSILISFHQSFVKINPYEIIYIEAENKTTKVTLTNNEINSKTTLTEFIDILKGFGFIQTHRSYLVNYRYIFAIHKESLVLENKVIIPISRHRLTKVKNRFHQLVLKDIK